MKTSSDPEYGRSDQDGKTTDTPGLDVPHYKGGVQIERALVAHLANETRVVSSLSRSEQEALGSLLAKLLEGLEERKTPTLSGDKEA